MLDPKSLELIRDEIQAAVDCDSRLLQELREEASAVKKATKQIRSHPTTAISLVGTDGGNNQITYDPFLIQLVRVVDSSENEYCLEAVTPFTDLDLLTDKHKHQNSPLWRMMQDLGVDSLTSLSPVFKRNSEERSPSWVQVYRLMNEWAVLLALVKKDYGTDTLIVFDGFLRCKMFTGGLFGKYIDCLNKEIKRNFDINKRTIYVVGLAKHTKVLQKYNLAMALEGAMRESYSCYARVPVELQKRAYEWSESFEGGGEGERFVGGIMYFVKFGSSKYDPIWAVDILDAQNEEASKVFGYLQADAEQGFPVPFYPHCLQKAHESAAVVDFDMDILQDEILEAIRNTLADKKSIIDELAMQSVDPSSSRYD